MKVIFDPKKRLIAAPSIPDRIVQRAVLDDLAPTYARGFSERSYAWGTGRGPHRAVYEAWAWNRRARFRMHLDVRRCFLEMHRPTLVALFARRLRDADTIALLCAHLDIGGRVYDRRLAIDALGLVAAPLPPEAGVAIGAYLSQWSGALYLDGLDHFVARVLKVRGYLRYMDDLLFFADDERRLEDTKAQVRVWLEQERRLAINPKTGAIESTSRPFRYLGYRISRGGVDASAKLQRRMSARLRAAAKKGPEALARTEAAYRGLVLFG